MTSANPSSIGLASEEDKVQQGIQGQETQGSAPQQPQQREGT